MPRRRPDPAGPEAADVTEDELERLKRATRHECPPWCHRCPLLADREVMPQCMGTAGTAHSPTDLSRCTCRRPGPVDRVSRLERLVAELTERVARLEAKRT